MRIRNLGQTVMGIALLIAGTFGGASTIFVYAYTATYEGVIPTGDGGTIYSDYDSNPLIGAGFVSLLLVAGGAVLIHYSVKLTDSSI
jgi:hypothetical protein